MPQDTHSSPDPSDRILPPEELFEHNLSPTHHIAFPSASKIMSVEFSPDGRTAYCAVDGTAIDLWSLGLGRWPEALGGTLALLALLYLLALARIRRRPQIEGDPHCARCNYHLLAHLNDNNEPGQAPVPLPRCPECGLETSKREPVKGRYLRRRLWLPTTLLLVFAAAYASLFTARFPRSAKAPDAPAIWSTWINDYAQRTQAPWLTKHSIQVTRLMTVDTQSGTISRCLRTMRGWVCLGMKVSPDGRFLALTESTKTLAWIRSDSGRKVAQTSGGSFMGVGMDEGFVLEIQAQEGDYQVYFKAVDLSTKTSRLLTWNPRSGQQHLLVEEPAYFDRSPHARRYALIHRNEGLATLSAPDFSQAYTEKKFTIVVRASPAEGGPGVVERTINVPDGGEFCTSQLLANHDGSMVFLTDYRTTIGYNANTGESLGQLPSPCRHIVNSEAMLLHQGRLFQSATPTESVMVRDVVKQTWLARLTIPDPYIGPKLSISDNGRWLAATPFMPTTSQTGPYIHELFLYDLTPLNSPPKPATPH